jgi:hypothetical protein
MRAISRRVRSPRVIEANLESASIHRRPNYGLQRTAGAHVRDKRTATSARRR